MSNGHKLELLSDGHGGAYLNYWDSLHGEDKCYHIARHLEVTVSEDGKDIPVNDLRMSLLGLLYSLDGADTMTDTEFAAYMGISIGGVNNGRE